MATPAAVMTSTSATGDVVTGPGYTQVLMNNMPVVTVGAMVSGAACVGTAAGNPVTTVIAGGKPILKITSTVTGTNPASGAPVSTTIANSSATTILV